MKIDVRLEAIYEEYKNNGKTETFADMLYELLDKMDQELLKKVRRARGVWKRRTNKVARENMKKKIDDFFAKMSIEELIKFQNTPWNDLPDWLKEADPKLVQHPEACNYVRIYGLAGKAQRQKEIAASRIVRYMEKNRLITSTEKGTKLNYEKFADICNELAEKFDLPWLDGKKAQKVRITARDLKNYTQERVTPKSDKMAVLASVTDLPLWYLSGYGDNNNPPSAGGNSLSPMGPGKYRKSRKKAA